MNNMLTLEEVKNFLEIEQEQVENYIQQSRLHAYKLGGVYLRFRKEEVLNLRQEIMPGHRKVRKPGKFWHRVADFWRFNNVYILALFLFILLTIFVIQE